MWDENTLKRCMEQNLQLVFGQKVLLLDLDTVNTIAGRPDVVLLNANRQLIVVEWESVLTLGNIGHALLDQAWHYAKHYYFEMLPSDIPDLYRRYYDYRFPGRELPDLHDALGIDHRLDAWDHSKPCVVVVGAWSVSEPAYAEAGSLITNTYAGEKRKMPCEVWVYDIHGSLDHDGNVAIVGCSRKLVFSADGRTVSHDARSGLTISNQHTSVRLTSEFQEVVQLMEQYVSDELGPYLEEFHSKVKWQRKLLKWSPWGTEKEICFEFSRMDGLNPIKGPHCSLRVAGRNEVGYRLQHRLRADVSDIAKKLRCSEDDLGWKGHTYPIIQYRVDDSSPQAIAEGFGRFCSVIYQRIDPVIRKALGEK